MRHSALLSLLLSLSLGSVLAASPAGCAAKTAAPEPAVKCTPGAYVFCRCQNRDEGTKLCGDDGRSFGPCLPCETPDNPALPDDPYNPPPVVDGGGDAQKPPAAVCGDKIVQQGEDCDDGNAVEDDGCNATCHLAGGNPAATRSCPGLETHVWSKPVTYVGTTVGSTFRGGLSPNCKSDGMNPTSGASGPDRIFYVTAHKTGVMTVSVSDVDYDALIYVTQSCVNAPDPISYLKCAHNTIGVGGETMSFPVEEGQSYSVLVDGAGISNYQGSFRLTLGIQ